MTSFDRHACLHPFNLQTIDTLRVIISLHQYVGPNFTCVLLRYRLRGLLLLIMGLCFIPLSMGRQIRSNNADQAYSPGLDFSGFLTSNNANLFKDDEVTLSLANVPQSASQASTPIDSNAINIPSPPLLKPNSHKQQRFLGAGPPYTVADAQVNQYVAGDQIAPSVAALKDGSFVVAWQSADQDTSGIGVYARIYSTNSAVYNSEFLVNTNITGDQAAPFVAALQDGGFIIAWASANQDSDGYGVFAQRYYANGKRYGLEFRANQNVTNSQYRAQVAGLTDGGYVIIWRSDNQDGSGAGIYGQIYNSNNSVRKSEFRVNVETSLDQKTPFVLALTDGRFLVLWQSNHQTSSLFKIFAQIYASDGTVIKAEFSTSPSSNSQSNGRAALLPNGDFIICWTSQLEDGDGNGISARRFNSSGTAVGASFIVNIYTTGSQEYAYSASLGSHGYVVAWSSFGQEGQDSEIEMQMYDLNNSRLYNHDIRVNDVISSTQSLVVLAASSKNKLMVVWQSRYQDGNGYGIFARLLDKDLSSIHFGESSCSLYNNVCDSPSTKIYNSNSEGLYDLDTQEIFSLGYSPVMDFLDKKGLAISYSIASTIKNNENAVDGLGNGLETSFYDLIVLAICSGLLCLYVASQKRHLDSTGRFYDKKTGAFTNTLKVYCKELCGPASLYWFIRPLYMYVKANRHSMRIDYAAICDKSAQQALFVLFFFLSKKVKLRYLKRFMEVKFSSQRNVLANWRTFIQDTLIILLVSSVQVCLPSNIKDHSFIGKCFGNIMYYVFVYLWTDQALEWIREKVCVDFLPIFSNSHLILYIRNCRYYNKAELYLLTAQQFCKKIISDAQEKFSTSELMLISCSNTNSSVQYLLVSKDDPERSSNFSVPFRIEQYRDKAKIGEMINSIANDMRNSHSNLLSSFSADSKLQLRTPTKHRTNKFSRSVHDLCLFVPILSGNSEYKEADLVLMDMNSDQEMTWKLQHASPGSIVYDSERQSLLLVTKKSTVDNITVRV